MPTFEERLSALESVVERLERGDLSLDDSVKLFEEGVQLSNSCKAELDKAEGRIQVLVDTRGAGRVEDLPEADGDSDELEGGEEVA